MSNDAISTVRMASFKPAAPTSVKAEAPDVPREGAPAQSVAPSTADAVRASARQIESFLKSTGRELEFRFDESSGQMVVSVRDASTGELIRQIPGEEVLRMARTLKESSPTLIDTKI